MSDPNMIVDASAWLAGLAITCVVLLKAWRGWLEIKRLDLAGGRTEYGSPTPAARIELADLKERVRKLEAIANGIES